MSGLLARIARRLWVEQPAIESASGPRADVSAPRGADYMNRIITPQAIARASAARRRAVEEDAAPA